MAFGRRRGQQVRAALATMAARDAEILLLKYAEEWSTTISPVI